MVKRLIVILLCTASLAYAVSLKDLVARISADVVPAASAIGGAVDLDGSTEYFADNSTTLLNSATSFSFSVWVYSRSIAPEYQPIFANNGTYRIVLSTSGRYGLPRNRYYVTTFFAGVTYGVVTPNYTTNKWQHLCATQSPTTWDIWLDGVSLGAASRSMGTVRQDSVFRLGGDPFSAVYKFNGMIDDAGIYINRVLTSNEVAEIYGAGTSPKKLTSLSTGTNGLVRYWKLDDGISNSSATQALDTVSGTYATGTAIGSGDWTNGIVPQ